MIESLAADLLNKYLGSFIEGVNKEQLNVGLWKGDIVLENLKLRRDALLQFNLPVDVYQGFLGRLTLKVPWKNLKTEPVIVEIDRVFFLAIPHYAMPYDPEQEARSRQEKKRQLLEQWEASREAATTTTRSSAEKDSDMDFLTKMGTRIVANLQLKIGSVHARFENTTVSKRGDIVPYTFGVTLKGMEITSTDANWNRTFVKKPGEFVHKILNVDHLAAYWNQNVPSFQHLSGEEMRDQFQRIIAERNAMQYVVAPLDLNGKLRLNVNPKPTPGTPKLDVSLDLQLLKVSVQHKQYHDFLTLLFEARDFVKSEKYRPFHPGVPFKGNAKAYWKFAIQSILTKIKDHNKRWTWAYIKDQRDRRKLYITLFKLHKGKDLSKAQKAQYHQLEDGLSFEEIRFFRTLAYLEMKREKKDTSLMAKLKQMKPKDKGGKEEGHESQGLQSAPASESSTPTSASSAKSTATSSKNKMMSWMKKVADKATVSKPKTSSHAEGALVVPKTSASATVARTSSSASDSSVNAASSSTDNTPEVNQAMEELVQSLDLDDAESVQFEMFPKDYVWATIQAKLGGIIELLIDDAEKKMQAPVLKMIFNELSFRFDQRKVNYTMNLALHSMNITGWSNAILLTPKRIDSNIHSDIFSMKLEHAPLDNRCDDVITMGLLPLEVNYDTPSVEKIIQFISPPVDPTSREIIKHVLTKQLSELKQMTRAGLEFHLSSMKLLELNMELDAPLISLVHNDGRAMVADLGHFSIKSSPVPVEKRNLLVQKQGQELNNEELEALREYMYSVFDIQLTNIQVVMGETRQQCYDAFNSVGAETTAFHVLSKSNASLHIHQSTVPNSIDLPLLKFRGEFPSLKFFVTEKNYKDVMTLINYMLGAFYRPHVAAAEIVPGNGVGYTDIEILEDSKVVDVSFLDDDDSKSSSAGMNEKWTQTIADVRIQFDRVDFFALTAKRECLAAVRVSGLALNVEDYMHNTDMVMTVQDVALVDVILALERNMDIYNDSVDLKKFPFILRGTELSAPSSEKTGGQQPKTFVIRLDLEAATPAHPQFKKKYHSIENSLKLEVGRIDGIVDARSFPVALDYVLNTFVPPDGSPTPIPCLENASLVDIFGVDQPHRLGAAEQRDNVEEKLKMVINLHGGQMFFSSKDQPLFCKLSLGTSTMEIQDSDNLTKFRGEFGTLEMFRCEGGLNAVVDKSLSVLSTNDQIFGVVSVESNSTPDKDSGLGEDNVSLELNSLRIFYNDWFVRSFLSFGAELYRNSSGLIDTIERVTLESKNFKIRSGAIVAMKNFSKLNIRIKSPQLIIPYEDEVVVYFGDLSISNSMVLHKDENYYIDDMVVEVKSVNIKMNFSSKEGSTEQSDMMHDFAVKIGVQTAEALTPTLPEKARKAVPKLRVVLDNSAVSFSLDDRQYASLLKLGMHIAEQIPGFMEPFSQQALPPIPPSGSTALVPQGTVVDELSLWQDELVLNLHMNGVSVALFHELVGKRECLAKLAFGDVKLNLFQRADKSMNLEALLTSLTLRDTREISDWDVDSSESPLDSASSSSLPLPSPNSENAVTLLPEVLSLTKQIRLTYSVTTAPYKAEEINAELGNLQVAVSAPFFAVLYGFFVFPIDSLPPPKPSTKSLERKKSKPVVDGKGSILAITAGKASGNNNNEKISSLKVNVKVDGIALIIVKDCTRLFTEALMVQVNGTSLLLGIYGSTQSPNSLSANFAIDDIHGSVCQLVESNPSKPSKELLGNIIDILDKFTMKANIQMNTANSERDNPDASTQLHLQVLVSQIDARISYQDVKLFVMFGARSKVLMRRYFKRRKFQIQPIDSAATELEERNEILTSVTKLASTSIASLSTSSSETSLATEAGISPAKIVLSLNIELNGINAKFINDYGKLNVPFFDFAMKPVFILAKDFLSETGVIKMDSPIQIEANFFNNKLSVWEPLIEPWDLDATITGGPNCANGTVVSVKSSHHLKVNLSHSLVSIASQYGGLWKSDILVDSKSVRQEYVPFQILNKTGYTLNIWDAMDQANGAALAEPVRVDDQKEVGWLPSAANWKESRTNNVIPKVCIGVKFLDSNIGTIESIFIHREGVLKFKIPEVELLHLVCEVVWLKGSKVVTLRSSKKVKNRTQKPLRLTTTLPNGKEHVQALEPGEVGSIPLKATGESKIFLSVADDSTTFENSTESLTVSEIVPKKTLNLSCRSLANPKVCNYFHLQCSLTSLGGTLLSVFSPFQFVNLFPCDISYTIHSKDQPAESGVILQGESQMINGVGLDAELGLSLKAEALGLATKRPFPFYDRRALKKKAKTPEPNDENNDEEVTGHGKYKKIPMVSASGASVNIFMGRKIVPGSSGARRITLIPPYVLINGTGVPVQYRQHRKTGSHGETHNDGIRRSNEELAVQIFSYDRWSISNLLSLRTMDSDWSAPFSLETLGTIGEISLLSQTPTKIKSDWSPCYQFGSHIASGRGKYNDSVVLTLRPRFVLLNKTGFPIQVCQCGKNGKHGERPNSVDLPYDGRKAFHFYSTKAGDNPRKDDMYLKLRQSEPNAVWTAPFAAQDIGDVFLKLVHSTAGDILLATQIFVEEATIFIRVTPSKVKPPIIIENRTTQQFYFCQQKVTQRRYLIDPDSRVPYVWDFPSLSEKQIVFAMEDPERNAAMDVSAVGQVEPLAGPNGVFSISLYADGHSRLIRIERADVDTENQKKFLFFSRKSTKQLKKLPSSNDKKKKSSSSSGGSSGKEDSAETESVTPGTSTASVSIRLKGFGLSLISDRPQELVYFSINDIDVELKETQLTREFSLNVASVQIDNQLHKPQFPCILFRATPTSEQEKRVYEDPMIKMLAVLFKPREDVVSNLRTFKYFSVLLQAVTVQLDEAFIMLLVRMMRSALETKLSLQDESYTLSPLMTQPTQELFPPMPVSRYTNTGEFVIPSSFFEVFQIQPIVINVTFVRSRVSQVDNDLVPRKGLIFMQPLHLIYNVLTMALGNIDGAPLRFNAIELQNAALPNHVLLARLGNHFADQGLQQLHKIVGSVDLIGNPVSLFNSVASGVEDFFYEPAQGIVKSPQDFVLGFGRGSASLLKNTIHGIFDGVSRITRSVGKGLAEATLDEEFQEKRNASQQEKSQHVLSGVAMGLTSFAKGLGSGLYGVVAKPVEGAKEEGVAGFAKGIGKGVVGVVSKPVVGLVDGVSKVAEGIGNTAMYFDSNKYVVERKRLPRCIPYDGRLTLYDADQAWGAEVLLNMKDGKYSKERYLCHVLVDGSKDLPKNVRAYVLLSSDHVLYFYQSASASKFSFLLGKDDIHIQWEVRTDNVLGLFHEKKKILTVKVTSEDGLQKMSVPMANVAKFEEFNHCYEAFRADAEQNARTNFVIGRDMDSDFSLVTDQGDIVSMSPSDAFSSSSSSSATSTP